MSSYARLGSVCETDMRVLLSNQKFLPLNAPIYKPSYTHMYQYPAQSRDTLPNLPMKNQTDNPYKSNCCGK